MSDVVLARELTLDECVERAKAMFGEELVSRAMTQSTAFSRDYIAHVTRHVFGECWYGDALAPRVRSLVTLAILGTLGREREFKLHLRAALRNGCTTAELRETFKHIGTYAGVPAGVEAFGIGEEILAETERP